MLETVYTVLQVLGNFMEEQGAKKPRCHFGKDGGTCSMRYVALFLNTSQKSGHELVQELENKLMDRIGSPETHSHIHAHLVYDKSRITTQ